MPAQTFDIDKPSKRGMLHLTHAQEQHRQCREHMSRPCETPFPSFLRVLRLGFDVEDVENKGQIRDENKTEDSIEAKRLHLNQDTYPLFLE